MGERRGAYRVWWGVLRERGHLEDLGVDGRKILRWIFRKRNVVAWTGSRWLRMMAGTCECGSEHLDSLKCAEFLD